jgi:hypothetical protein
MQQEIQHLQFEPVQYNSKLFDQQLNFMIRGQFDQGYKICQMIDNNISSEHQDYKALQFNKAWFCLREGKLKEGYQLLDYGRFINVYGNPPLNTNKPLWKQENLKDKKVILNLEGGFGDQILTVRFAKDIVKREGECIVCCHQDLKPLLQRVKGVQKCITEKDISETNHDYWIPSFSCPWLFDHTWNSLYSGPYITTASKYNSIWKNKLKSKKIKIGIRWAGLPYFEHQQFRLFPPQRLINLSKYSKLQIYSLQRDNNLVELPKNITDLRNDLTTWNDTAAVINNLDLIITSCTSIAHLASAMGKPTWIIIPILPYHVWTYGDKHSPWYGETTELYRQTKFGHWEDVFDKIEKDLIEKFKLQLD